MSNTLSAVWKKYQNIILPILAVIIALILFVLVVLPQALKIPTTISQIQKSQDDLQSLNTKLSTLQSINSEKYRADLETTFAALPQDPDIQGVFNQILQTINANTLALNTATVSEVPDINNSKMTDYVLKIETTGSTISLNNFIDQTKAIPRVIKVQSFDGAPVINNITTTQAQPAVTATPASNSAQIQNNQTLTLAIIIQSFYQTVPKTQTLQTEQPVRLPTASDEATIANIQAEIAAMPPPASAATNIPSGKPDPFQ